MSSTSHVLIRNTAADLSEPVRVDRRAPQSDFVHTVSITASNFRGRVSIEATLQAEPGEGDWFKVLLNGEREIAYPRSGSGAETSTLGFSFRGRFVWLRARVEAEADAPPEAVGFGLIDRILLNF